MRFSRVLGIIFILWGTCVCNQASAAPQTRVIKSPNGKYAVIVRDDRDYNRVIELVELKTKVVVFHYLTTVSSTLVAWNKTSSRCAISDAPTNAENELWIFTRVSGRTSFPWQRDEIDVPFEGIDTSKDNGLHHLGRGGIMKMKWKTDTILWCDTIWDNVIYDVYFSTKIRPMSTRTVRTDRKFN